MKGHTPWNKGIKNAIKRVSVNNGEITKRIPEDELQTFLDNGWQRGRHDKQRISAIVSKATKGKSSPNKGMHLTDEQKEHLRQINLGKKQSSETIEKRREKLIGHKVSEETRQRLREANVGQQRSDEARRNMSMAKKGKSPPNKGKPMSEEQKEKLSQNGKGRLWITNGEIDKTIKQEEYTYYENIGFYRGRSNAKKHKRRTEDENKNQT